MPSACLPALPSCPWPKPHPIGLTPLPPSPPAPQALAADPQIYERLSASIAPSIWQLEDVKKGVLCQLFGGVSKVGAGAGSTPGLYSWGLEYQRLRAATPAPWNATRVWQHLFA